MEVNGKFYPMWGNFVEKKDEFIGGILQDLDMGYCIETKITDITLTPNGKDSAFFSVVGEEFTCGFDTGHGGITGGDTGWMTFSGYSGHKWRIKKENGRES